MTDFEIRTTRLQVRNQDLDIDAYLAEPTAEGPFPGIVVLQEIFGVNAHIRDITERFAKAGYVAIAPALYQRLEPGFETGYTAEDLEIGRDYKARTDADELLGDIQAAINHLKSLDSVASDAIGCIGFCFGGHVAYLAATLPDIKATASFYGAGITTWCPGDSEPTVTRTSQISGKIYAFFGMDDTSIPQDQVDVIEAELQKHQIPYQVFRYPNAGHGFFCDQRDSYSPEASRDAWDKVQELLSRELKSATSTP
ncbi:MAG: dienelactone hydrolase family protein [Elainellaceae cyanobacterium]